MTTPRGTRPGPAALVVAHPGHELRLHHWLELHRPVVCVLTDGSGREGRSRLRSTSRVLSATGARSGAIYGRYTDRAFYELVLSGDVGWATGLAAELATILAGDAVTVVAGDAAEGYNSTHDVCRLITNAAVRLVEREHGRRITNYDFPLRAAPVGPDTDRGVRLRLSDEALARKLATARAYRELADEVEDQITRFGDDAFRGEALRPAETAVVHPVIELPPYYERHGERQVAAGHYPDVIRYTTHVQPLARALWRLEARP